MNKLKQPSKKHQELLSEWVRQYNSGEYAAKYWTWLNNVGPLLLNPQFTEGVEYRFEPSPHHPHYSICKEWEKHKESGAVDRGEYELRWVNSAHHNVSNWQPTSTPRWEVVNSYELRKTDKHPDNQKPKLKVINWANAPVGTMTNKGEIVVVNQEGTYETALVVHTTEGWTCNVRVDHLRIVPATNWTAVQDGEEPPVCAGLVIEYRYSNVVYDGAMWRAKHDITLVHDTNLINAYRVTGIALGYTDVTEEAVCFI